MFRDNNYIFNSSVVLRTPVYNYIDHDAASGVQAHLSDPFFRSSIALASTSLYNELVAAGFNYEMLSNKVKFTLNKYYNRMCYRPTPFGKFSGIGVVPWGEDDLIIKSNAHKTHIFYDFSDSVKLADDLVQQYLRDQLTYQVNGSLYKLRNEYRYLKSNHGPEEKRTFFLHNVERSRELDQLFTYLSVARPESAIVTFLTEQFYCSPAEASEIFSQLAGEQIIVPSLQPAVTGDDYLDRVKMMCTTVTSHSREREQPMTAIHEGPLYVNLEHIHISGSANSKYHQAIMDGLYAIDRLVPTREHSGLQEFIRQFEQKFDRRIVPLMEALDPETGIGYESLAGDIHPSALLKDVSIPAHRDERRYQTNWSDMHTYLLQQWNHILQGSDPHVITLEKEDLEKLPSQEAVYPQSMSVLFRAMGALVYIEQAGGISATALQGRFTLFNDQIWAEARQLAALEEKVNPDVIFAEISHICDDHTANIDRRRHIRNYEIPVLTGSSLPADQQIQLSDLWVTVADGRIMLWSAKLKKVIVPRLSSAFNYFRNDLSVFRFLCDLQYQGLKSNFNFDLSDFFPGMHFYPRVRYGKAILQLATWHLQADKLIGLSLCTTDAAKVTLLKTWCTELGWPRHISLDEQDNQLVFDTSDETSLLFLAENLKGAKKAVIKEFPFCNDDTAMVRDQQHKPFVHQMVAALYHTHPIYNIPLYRQFKPAARYSARRKYIPGSEWLYVKIYCHPGRANEILLALAPYLEPRPNKTGIKKWFFIRYRDPGFHVRIRLNIIPEYIGSVMRTFKKRLSGHVDSGLVSSLQLSTYDRETERYSVSLMPEVEQLFCDSTALVLAFMKNGAVDESSMDYYQPAFSSIIRMAAIFGFTLDKNIEIFQGLYQSMLQEFDVTAALNEQFKKKYRHIKNNRVIVDSPMAYPPDVMMKIEALEHTCLRIGRRSAGWKEEELVTLFADMIHMHLNRLLVDDARKQELLIYYCLFKYYQSEKGRRNTKGDAVSSLTISR